MSTLFVAASIAAALTAVYAFRFEASREPWRLLKYFLLFLAAEWIGEHFFLPPGTIGPEVGFVALGITLLFVIASRVRDELDPRG